MRHDRTLVKKLEELIADQKFSLSAVALAYIKNRAEENSTEICETTLCNYIYRGDVFLVLDERHLCEKRRRHHAEKSKKQTARTPLGESIGNRPKEMGKWKKFGHWEMDSIYGVQRIKTSAAGSDRAANLHGEHYSGRRPHGGKRGKGDQPLGTEIG